MLGISGEGGSAAKLWTTQGEDRPLAWCSWRHRGHALCVCSVCRTCHLTSGPRGQTSTFSLSMFAASGSCVFASNLTGGADVPLSMREAGVRVDRCRFRVVMKAMSPSTCDGKAGGVAAWVVGWIPGSTLPTRFFGNAGRTGTARPDRTVARAQGQKDTGRQAASSARQLLAPDTNQFWLSSNSIFCAAPNDGIPASRDTRIRRPWTRINSLPFF